MLLANREATIWTKGAKMKFIEMIQLRMAGNQRIASMKDLLNQALDVDTEEPSQKISIYRHHSIEGDVCILLHCTSDGLVKPPSDLGLRLTSSLRGFGQVHHAVWVQI